MQLLLSPNPNERPSAAAILKSFEHLRDVSAFSNTSSTQQGPSAPASISLQRSLPDISATLTESPVSPRSNGRQERWRTFASYVLWALASMCLHFLLLSVGLDMDLFAKIQATMGVSSAFWMAVLVILLTMGAFLQR